MKLLQKGWVLVGGGLCAGYDLDSPDGKTRRHVWNNAANSCIKRDLICIGGDNVDGFRYAVKKVAA